MKRALLYSIAALILGLVLTLVPLVTFAELKTKESIGRFLSGTSLEKLEGYYCLDSLRYSFVDLEIFTISFVIALSVYALFKHKTSSYV
ncbi:MAG: hypothetical protein OEZ21_02270 [Candidatus Bathyarchaeota archaeon]|nr:hypothetical protein [Candidatus Bathyarchaeota archaeon]MDH5745772.1 hypothetical protein [Candidatus Bathyarchaeota archaeon]